MKPAGVKADADDFDKAAIVIAVSSGDLVVEQGDTFSTPATGSYFSSLHGPGTEFTRVNGSPHYRAHSVRRIHIRASDLCASLGITVPPSSDVALMYADGVRAALDAVATAKYDAESEGRAWSVRDVVVPGI